MAVQGLATVGTIASFITYTRQFGRPLNEIANLYNAIQGAVAGVERVFEVVDEPSEVDAPEARRSRPRFRHRPADTRAGSRRDERRLP